MKFCLDWTYDKDGAYPDLRDIVDDLHSRLQKYVIVVVSGTIWWLILWSSALAYVAEIGTSVHFVFHVETEPETSYLQWKNSYHAKQCVLTVSLPTICIASIISSYFTVCTTQVASFYFEFSGFTR